MLFLPLVVGILGCLDSGPKPDVQLSMKEVRIGDDRFQWPVRFSEFPGSGSVIGLYDLMSDRTYPLDVAVDEDVPANWVAALRGLVYDDRTQWIRTRTGKVEREIRYMGTSNKSPPEMTCWLPIVHVPSGIVLVNAGVHRGSVFVRRPVFMLKNKRGCGFLRDEVQSALDSIPNRCEVTAIAMDSSVRWREAAPWLDSVENPRLLDYEPRNSHSSFDWNAGSCGRARLPSEFGDVPQPSSW